MVWELAVPIARLGWSRVPRDGAAVVGCCGAPRQQCQEVPQKAGTGQEPVCGWLKPSRAGDGDSLPIRASLTQHRGRVLPGLEASITPPAGSASIRMGAHGVPWAPRCWQTPSRACGSPASKPNRLRARPLTQLRSPAGINEWHLAVGRWGRVVTCSTGQPMSLCMPELRVLTDVLIPCCRVSLSLNAVTTGMVAGLALTKHCFLSWSCPCLGREGIPPAGPLHPCSWR